MAEKEEFDLVVTPQKNLLDINFADIWRYRDLLYMFVKRDIVTVYKQTVMGPLWFFVQPILTTLIYIVVFGTIAGITTNGIPKPLFYLSGIVMWNYFSECFNSTSNTFVANSGIFGKVYFPRLIVPMSRVASGLIKFFIQLALLSVLYIYYCVHEGAFIPNWALLLLPLYIVIMALMALGAGIIFSSMTTKYRDLTFLIGFGVQLLMYATPVIYPLSTVPAKLLPYIKLNPITYIIEAFRYSLFGQGVFSVNGLIYASCFAVVILMIGVVIFNRTERSFMDVV
ncbi:ABC transporter permease [Parabacteroides sp. FAFU027]|uniref:ABC transporter permease n=1 Tax=Parabacteroides sp. FAFU027 TaxID=2922715 RepID=UPI001FAEC2C9|nr:ABC transporter permease [Parabacteroides sp. FAFU027]